MAAIDDLIAQIDNPELRDKIQQELRKVTKNKKFGLVFERHLPECTPLYDIPVKKGATVAKYGDINTLYKVLNIENDIALCMGKNVDVTEKIAVDELVTVAEFGEPIYPYLEPLDSVENAPDSGLWHTLIEADNYHALQLLDYLYHGKVDCIYIDPPYNTGAKDWKYNNDYVDGNDSYRHSKWLSMMEKRLLLAKKLLNPKDSVLIVTIDEKEYLHLGCLLEELFPDARMQMISDVINPRGTTREGSFSRTDEYIYVLQFGCNSVFYPQAGEKHYVEWYRLRRTDLESRRGTVKGGTQQFYPIYIDVKTEEIVHIGEPIPANVDRNTVPSIEGAVAVFPIKNDGTEMNWGVTPDTLKQLMKYHFVRVRKNSKGKPQQYLLHYISYVQIEAIKSGKSIIEGYNEDGTAIVVEEDGHIIRPGSAWNISTHNAGTYGTEILASLIKGKKFTFPKSIYSTFDILKYFFSQKRDGIILDFFAGSGTTLHAVNLLNAEDGGNRRCILVTNNEVSEDEAKSLIKQGHKPGDDEWNKLGIARYVTWPRTVCSIKGHDINGHPLKGEYGAQVEKFIKCTNEDKDEENGKSSKIVLYKRVKEQVYPNLDGKKIADGFHANANFFKLGFLDKMAVRLGTQLEKLIPVLWMKANAVGKCPTISDDRDYYIFPENRFAILVNESKFNEFKDKIADKDLDVVYLVTDYEPGYIRMRQELGIPTAYQLYRDYLDNFRINQR